MVTKARLLHDTVIIPSGSVATTQSASDNTTKVATTAYVTTAIANLADSAPSTLNTLNELAAALGDDANFSTTVTNSIATKLPLAGGTMTGALVVTGDANPALEISRGSANTTNVNLKYNTTLTGQLSAANGKFQISAAGSGTEMEFYVNGSKRLEIDTEGALIFTNAGVSFNSNNKIFAHTNNFQYILGGSNGLYLSDNGDLGNAIGIRNDNFIDFVTNGSEAMRIDINGRLGIGMTPSNHAGYMLQMTGGSQSFIAIGNDTTGTGALNGLVIGNDSTGADIYQRENQPLRFHTNNLERMRIDSSGTMILQADGASNLGRIQFSSQAATYQIVGGNNVGYLGYKTGGYHRFFGSDGLEAMRINSNKKVSIGGTEDTYDLMIKRPTAASATSLVLQRVWNQNQGWQAEALTEYFTDLDSSSYPRAQVGFYRGDNGDNNSSGFIVKTGTSSAGMATNFKVDATGMVEMPKQPAFMAVLSSGQTITSTNTTIAFNTESFDRQNNHASGVFTAPHAGVYLFGCNFLVYPLSSGIINVGFYKGSSNYSSIVQGGASAQSHERISHQCLIECAKNDEISVKISGSSLTSGASVYGSQAYWWGYMVG